MTKCDILYVTLMHDSRQFRFFQKNSNFPEECYVHRTSTYAKRGSGTESKTLGSYHSENAGTPSRKGQRRTCRKDKAGGDNETGETLRGGVDSQSSGKLRRAVRGSETSVELDSKIKCETELIM